MKHVFYLMHPAPYVLPAVPVFRRRKPTVVSRNPGLTGAWLPQRRTGDNIQHAGAGKAVFTKEGKRRFEHALADGAGDVLGLNVGQG
jgi:hypothetical protein